MRASASAFARALVARGRVVWLLFGVAVVAVVVLVSVGHKPAAPPATTTTTVQRGTVTVAVSAAGTIKSSDTRGLSFSLAGTVTEVDVRPGDLVKAGQVLARIDPTDAQATVNSAQSRVNDAQTALTKAQQTAALPPCPTANPTPSRPASPAPSGSTPTPTPSGTAATAAAHGLAQAASTPTCAQPNRNATSDPVLSAQQTLNNSQLALTQAQAKLAGTVITAPIEGRVLSVGGAIGSRASAGGTGFIVLGQVSTLAVYAQFSEADVGRLAVGEVASITLPDRLDPVGGKVSQIDPAGTISNRLVRYGVVIAFDQLPDNLLLGESVTALVTTASRDDVLYIASAAVVSSGQDTATVTVRNGNHNETRTVGIGLRGDQYTEITSGLTEGEVVVLPSSA